MLSYLLKFLFFLIFIIIPQTSNVECKLQRLSTQKNDSFINIILSQSLIMKKKKTKQRIKTFMDLVAPEYVAEEHTVVTADGYILSIHRIPGNFQHSNGQRKPAVLLLHGIMGASDIWILRGPNQDFPYSLVNNGYDVWALNVRGNYYSKRHQQLSPCDPEFWQFSWHEIGVYDVPAAVDYILKITRQSKLSLVGHSMGGTVELVFLSELFEYNSKVNVAIAWAPVAVVTHDVPGLLNNIIFRHGDKLKKLLNLLNIHEIYPRNLSIMDDFVDRFLKLCVKLHIRDVCAKLYEYIFGIDDLDELDFSLLTRASHHYPQGTSIQTLYHYRQIIINRQFRRYDFGPIGNAKKYGSLINSPYPLHKIFAPLVIYYGLDDPLSTPDDIEALLNAIPHAAAKQIPHRKFGHLDFLLLNQTKFFYSDVIQVLNNYNNNTK